MSEESTTEEEQPEESEPSEVEIETDDEGNVTVTGAFAEHFAEHVVEGICAVSIAIITIAGDTGNAAIYTIGSIGLGKQLFKRGE